MDPPSVVRYGGDFLSAPLPAGSSLAACVSLCCATASCVAFSYNDPQPQHTCVGGQCCVAGGLCCMLKSTPGTLVNNTYGPAVLTGLLPLPDNPPTPPFPASSVLLNASFGAVSFWNGSGDTWPSAWAADGSLYGWDCDSYGSPMSLWRVDGDPFEPGGLNPVNRAMQAIDYEHMCAYLGPTGSYPKINVKPAGMMALPPSPGAPNGTLLTGISCMNYGDDAAFNRQHNLAGFLATSVDGGATWANATPVGTPTFSGALAAPVFVSCGQANGPCAAKDGGYIYAFFPGAFDGQAYWDNNDAMFLGRVPNASYADVGAWDFFVGLDGAGAPQWLPDPSQAQPSVQFARMLGENGVTYHPGLSRYLIANFGFIDAQGNPRPWHSQPFMSPHRTQMIFLEAPNPWGPWSIFYRTDDTPLAPGLYTPTFPAKYIQPIVPGSDEAQLILFFACLDGAPSCRYTLNYVNVTIQLATGVF